MNLFRAEVEIAIGGKKRLFKFGINQLALYTEKHKISLSEAEMSVAQIRDLFWSALVCGAKKKKQEVDFDEWDVGEWIDDMDQADFETVIEAMNQSFPEGQDKKGSKKK
tara:strand:- start:188 stop:514 length:327 start_codon:yes stop_codon:yes gene_type:complete